MIRLKALWSILRGKPTGYLLDLDASESVLTIVGDGYAFYGGQIHFAGPIGDVGRVVGASAVRECPNCGATYLLNPGRLAESVRMADSEHICGTKGTPE